MDRVWAKCHKTHQKAINFFCGGGFGWDVPTRDFRSGQALPSHVQIQLFFLSNVNLIFCLSVVKATFLASFSFQTLERSYLLRLNGKGRWQCLMIYEPQCVQGGESWFVNHRVYRVGVSWFMNHNVYRVVNHDSWTTVCTGWWIMIREPQCVQGGVSWFMNHSVYRVVYHDSWTTVCTGWCIMIREPQCVQGGVSWFVNHNVYRVVYHDSWTTMCTGWCIMIREPQCVQGGVSWFMNHSVYRVVYHDSWTTVCTGQSLQCILVVHWACHCCCCCCCCCGMFESRQCL